MMMTTTTTTMMMMMMMMVIMKIQRIFLEFFLLSISQLFNELTFNSKFSSKLNASFKFHNMPKSGFL